MRVERSDSFQKRFEELSKKDKKLRKRVEEVLSHLEERGPGYRGLALQRIKGVPGYWELWVRRKGYRIILERIEEGYRLLDIGKSPFH